MPVCPKCGAVCPEAAEYCEECGEALTEPTALTDIQDAPDGAAEDTHNNPDGATEDTQDNLYSATEDTKDNPDGLTAPDLFAAAAAEEERLRAEYRSRKLRSQAEKAKEKPDTVRPDAPGDAPEPPAEPEKNLLTGKQKALRVTALAAAGALLCGAALHFRGTLTEPEPETSAVPTLQKRYEGSESACYFKGTELWYYNPQKKEECKLWPTPKGSSPQNSVSDFSGMVELKEDEGEDDVVARSGMNVLKDLNSLIKVSQNGNRLYFPDRLPAGPDTAYSLWTIDLMGPDQTPAQIAYGTKFKGDYKMLSPDGSQIAALSPSGELRIANAPVVYNFDDSTGSDEMQYDASDSVMVGISLDPLDFWTTSACPNEIFAVVGADSDYLEEFETGPYMSDETDELPKRHMYGSTIFRIELMGNAIGMETVAQNVEDYHCFGTDNCNIVYTYYDTAYTYKQLACQHLSRVGAQQRICSFDVDTPVCFIGCSDESIYFSTSEKSGEYHGAPAHSVWNCGFHTPWADDSDTDTVIIWCDKENPLYRTQMDIFQEYDLLVENVLYPIGLDEDSSDSAIWIFPGQGCEPAAIGMNVNAPESETPWLALYKQSVMSIRCASGEEIVDLCFYKGKDKYSNVSKMILGSLAEETETVRSRPPQPEDDPFIHTITAIGEVWDDETGYVEIGAVSTNIGCSQNVLFAFDRLLNYSLNYAENNGQTATYWLYDGSYLVNGAMRLDSFCYAPFSGGCYFIGDWDSAHQWGTLYLYAGDNLVTVAEHVRQVQITGEEVSYVAVGGDGSAHYSRYDSRQQTEGLIAENADWIVS